MEAEASDFAYLFSRIEAVSSVATFSTITGSSNQAVSLTIFSTTRISTLVLSVTVGSWRIVLQAEAQRSRRTGKKFFIGWYRALFGFVEFVLDFSFHPVDLGVKACRYTENGAAQNKEFADDADGRVCDLARRRDEEQAHGGNGHAGREAGDGDASLEPGEFCAFLLSHRAQDYSPSRTRKAKMNGS